uniref:Uncharacterized protein n=1 Tax=Kalanchoe fedtschenkoi TaxID=63787 RepID=A0A7N0UMX5_KALFE
MARSQMRESGFAFLFVAGSRSDDEKATVLGTNSVKPSSPVTSIMANEEEEDQQRSERKRFDWR